jgi:protein phosphatase
MIAPAQFSNPGLIPVIGFDEIQHFTASDVGIRRSHNQDAYTVILAKNPDSWHQEGHVFMVADGMGGHAVGEKASAKAVRDVPLNYLKHVSGGVASALRRAFLETNAGIHAIGQNNPEFKGLGTTATALILRPEGAWFAHVGDSRAYRIRDGHIQQLTFDHSYVWEMARRQQCAPEDIQGMRSNVIVRSLGPDALVQVDIEGPHPIQPGDVFVLCSDGLSGPVSDPEIGAVATTLPPEEACEFLIQLANLRGGPDNITVQIVRMGGPDPEKAAKRHVFLPSVPLVHWSIPVLTLGVALVILAVMLALDVRWVGILLFLLAIVTNIGGIVGLVLHARAEKRRRENQPPPPNINIYRQTLCAVDEGVVEKLARATANLETKIREHSPDLIPDTFTPHYALGKEHACKKNHIEAFREFCRAMHELAKSYNKTRNKPEMFMPLWDKHAPH